MITLEDARRVIREHFDELRKLYGVKDIEIFGSYARNEQRTDSDLDLLVEFEQPVGLLTISMLQVHLSELLGVEVDVVPKNSLRKELWDEVSREAVKV
ncbi:nucleotidyltransferase family protein [Thermococcus nautili]|uniref:protein adenylyltransferase n=1 Tax=Thermococcus nautili TaxID=195522 RepID=W8NZ62_9EURY|nr:nucleotidyltransferase family protein [Thermococcus nautili]AHL21711.1 putative nucleotidyltransferase [Thermococcus nautili]CAI1491973.1 Putative nucleotidyltransferase [Thermococcus nautili]